MAGHAEEGDPAGHPDRRAQRCPVPRSTEGSGLSAGGTRVPSPIALSGSSIPELQEQSERTGEVAPPALAGAAGLRWWQTPSLTQSAAAVPVRAASSMAG